MQDAVLLHEKIVSAMLCENGLGCAMISE